MIRLNPEYPPCIRRTFWHFAPPMFSFRHTVVVAGLALAMASGCAGDCRRLSEKLCECSIGTLERNACKQRVAQEDSRIAPTAEDEARCKDLLPICDCHTISTPEGKRACGLARYPDAGTNPDGGT